MGGTRREEEEAGTGRLACRSKYWKINAMNHVNSYDATVSVKFVKIVMNRLVQSSKRKTCTRLEQTDRTTNVNRSNKFDVFESKRKLT